VESSSTFESPEPFEGESLSVVFCERHWDPAPYGADQSAPKLWPQIMESYYQTLQHRHGTLCNTLGQCANPNRAIYIGQCTP